MALRNRVLLEREMTHKPADPFHTSLPTGEPEAATPTSLDTLIDTLLDEVESNMTPQQFEEAIVANEQAIEKARRRFYGRAGITGAGGQGGGTADECHNCNLPAPLPWRCAGKGECGCPCHRKSSV